MSETLEPMATEVDQKQLAVVGSGQGAGRRAGRPERVAGSAVVGEIGAWAAHRARRVAVRTATKNQLLGQLDRAFPGLSPALPDVLGTTIGRLIVAELSDPARLAAWSESQLIGFAAAHDFRLHRPLARRLITAANEALPTAEVGVARRRRGAPGRPGHPDWRHRDRVDRAGARVARSRR